MNLPEPSVSAPSSASPWRARFDLFARALVSVLWLAAGAFKLADPAAFARDIEHYRLLPALGSAALAVYLPWLELVLGVALWLPRFREAARGLSLALLGVFGVVLAAALVRGLDIRCGCFGASGPDSSAAWALARNAVLALLLWGGRRLSPSPSL